MKRLSFPPLVIASLSTALFISGCSTGSTRSQPDEAAQSFSLKNLDFLSLAPSAVVGDETKQLPADIGVIGSGDIKQIARYFVWADSQKSDQVGRPIGSEGAATLDIVRSLFDLHEDFAGHFCADLGAMRSIAETNPGFENPTSDKAAFASFDSDKPKKGTRYTYDARITETGDKQWRFTHFDANPLGDAFVFRFEPLKHLLHEFIYFRDGGIYEAIFPLKFRPDTKRWIRDETQAVRLRVDLVGSAQEYELVLTGNRVSFERRTLEADHSVSWLRGAFDGKWGLTNGPHPVYIPREFALIAKDYKSAAALDISREGPHYIRYATNATLRSLKVPKADPKAMSLHDLRTTSHLDDTLNMMNMEGIKVEKSTRDDQLSRCRSRGFNQVFFTGSDDYRRAFAREFEVKAAEENAPPAAHK